MKARMERRRRERVVKSSNFMAILTQLVSLTSYLKIEIEKCGGRRKRRIVKVRDPMEETSDMGVMTNGTGGVRVKPSRFPPNLDLSSFYSSFLALV